MASGNTAAAGRKRKKASKTPSDFKHIKAKVGKRAPKPANVTDTSFKAATLAVRAQTVPTSDSSAAAALVSSRGRSLSQFTTQLQHPAAAVRLSALRGLSDAVGNASSDVLQSHLSVLLPTLAQSGCVDDDDDVRSLGLTVLQDVLQRVFYDNKIHTIRPFLALLVAYVSSALHSLDRSTRRDGARAVQILSTTTHSLLRPHVATLLPAFVQLLSDRRRAGNHAATTKEDANSTQPGAKKKRRKGASDQARIGRLGILQAFLSMLQTVKSGDEGSTSLVCKGNFILGGPDVRFLPGGRSLNGLLVGLGKFAPHSVYPTRLDSMKSLSEKETNASTSLSRAGGLKTPASQQEDTALPQNVAQDLLTKLRDMYIEVTQRGHAADSGGLVLTAEDAEEFALLVASIRLLWNTSCRRLSNHCSGKNAEQLTKVFTSVLSLMLESFPVHLQSPEKYHMEQCGKLNADFCVVLMNIGGFIAVVSKDVEWIDPVLNYLVTRLERENEALDSQFSGTSGTVVDVLSKLLLLKQVPPEFTLSQIQRVAILEKLRQVYFSIEDGSEKDLILARSAAGRRAAVMIPELLISENFKVTGSETQPVGQELRKMVMQLPLYLKAWGRDFVAESLMVVSVLHDLARRIDLDSLANDEVVVHLRQALVSLFLVPKKSTEKSRSALSDDGLSSSLSIFEYYPETGQRQVMGLVAMLQRPSDEIIDSLSRICAQASTPQHMSSYIMQVIHSIRRTMSMKAYLCFLIKCIRLENRPNESTSKDCPSSDVAMKILRGELDVICSPDDSIRCTSQLLIFCGSDKVLPLISPLLANWLENTDEDSMTSMMRNRAAMYIAAMLSFDIKSSIVSLETKLSKKLIFVSCAMLFLCGTCIRRGARVDVLECFLKPVINFMQGDSLFLVALFEEIAQMITKHLLDKIRLADVVEVLLFLLHNEGLAVPLRQCAPAVRDCCSALEQALRDGTTDHKVSSLQTTAQILFGETPG